MSRSRQDYSVINPTRLVAAWIFLAANLAAQSPSGKSEVVEGQTTISLPDSLRMNSAEREILRLERKRSAAIASHDTVWLMTVYAQDFRGVTANGARVDRSALFRVFARDNPDSRFLIDELEVQWLSPTTALVRGRLTTLTTAGQVLGSSRYLHVYLKRGERWEIVAAQGTVVVSS
jgi:hypothetical protein